MLSFAAAAAPSKLNVVLWGPSGAGKTYTGLAIAHQLGQRVAVVDTEHGASSLYAARFPADMAEMAPPFSPEQFIEAIRVVEAAHYDVILFDSLSPEWDGPGGCLDILAGIQKRGVKGARAWRDVTPRHEALLGAINRTPLSVIVTLREKPRVLLDTAEQTGKTQVTAGGPRAVMRERFEYEYDLVLHIDMQHRVTADKSRLFALREGTTGPADGSLLNAIAAAMHPERALASDPVS